MPDQDTQTKTYPLKNRGAVSKLDPALLADGQLINSVNTASTVEGEITSRPGRLLLGHMPGGAILPHKICKLAIPAQVIPISNATNTAPIVITTTIPHGWQTGFQVNIQGVTGNTNANASDITITVTGPSSFSLNGVNGNGAYVNGGTVTISSGDPSLCYIGEEGDIWRTNTAYATGSYAKVNPSNVLAGFDPFSIGWSMAPYSAGTTGNPIAYFATPAVMLKDQGNAPFATLEVWGITQALAAAGAVNAAGTSYAVANATASGTLIEIQTAANPFTTGQTVSMTGVLGTTEANGTWVITVIDATHFTLNNSTFVNAYVGGGEAVIAGPDSTQPGATPYDYVYTFRDPLTGNEGNPSAFMDSTLAVASQNGSITVTVWGSPDPKITGAQSIFIYRRGGSFADGIFRQIGFVTNPGVSGAGVPLSATFTDTTPDIGLVFVNNQAEFDNFPPVVSTLRVPVNATIVSGNPGLSPGWNILTLSSSVQNILTVGSSLVLGSSSGSSSNNQETVVIAALTSPATGANSTVLVYLQLQHAAGEPVEIGSVAGQPCSLLTIAFDCAFLAGDTNNPHTLYQSKTGRPEAFPIIDSLGNAHTINVGTPSNGIQNHCEFRGKILCLNLDNLFEVDFFQGVMYGPNETPCERGLVSRWAWCKSENVVYYLSWDGIWTWDGSQSRKITESIDTVFNTPSFGFPSLPPLDTSRIGQCRMEYYRNQVFFLYPSPNVVANYVLRYDTLYSRWTIEIHGPVALNQYISSFFLEKENNHFIFGRTDPGGAVMSMYNAVQGLTVGYSDEYSDIEEGLNGTVFFCSVQPGFFRPEDFTRVKLFQDVLIEASIGGAGGQLDVNMAYDYAGGDAIDIFTISAPSTARKVYPLPLQLTGTPAIPLGKEAFAVSPFMSWASTAIVALYSVGIRYLDRDAVQAGMASDWMNLGSNNDKRIYQIHLEHNTSGLVVNLHMDIRYGINGTLQKNDVAIFTITSSEKTTVTLPVPETGFPGNLTICKSVRLRGEYQQPNSDPQTSVGLTYRIFYKPTFDSEPYPPDQVLFTPWKDFGYPCEKIAKVLNIDVDTGGVQASIQTQTDGANVGAPFLVTTTANDRKRNLPFASTPQPIGKLWRLTELPGAGGKAQLFDWSIDFQKEPCQITFFDTFELSFGYDGYKLVKQVWLDFFCTAPITFTLITDNGNVLFVTQLPPQANRNVVRFYLPQSNAPIIGYVNTTGAIVTWLDGQKFTGVMVGDLILIAGVVYTVAVVTSDTSLTLTASAGAQADVPYGFFTVGTVLALNKSKIYRIQVASTTAAGFKVYMESSRIEWAAVGAEQRGAYQQMRLSELSKFTP